MPDRQSPSLACFEITKCVLASQPYVVSPANQERRYFATSQQSVGPSPLSLRHHTHRAPHSFVRPFHSPPLVSCPAKPRHPACLVSFHTLRAFAPSFRPLSLPSTSPLCLAPPALVHASTSLRPMCVCTCIYKTSCSKAHPNLETPLCCTHKQLHTQAAAGHPVPAAAHTCSRSCLVCFCSHKQPQPSLPCLSLLHTHAPAAVFTSCHHAWS